MHPAVAERSILRARACSYVGRTSARGKPVRLGRVCATAVTSTPTTLHLGSRASTVGSSPATDLTPPLAPGRHNPTKR